MEAPRWPTRDDRLQPPSMVLHARVGKTVLWLQRVLLGRRQWSSDMRLDMSAMLLRFAQLFVVVDTPLYDHFVGAARMLSHPCDHALEDSLTFAHTAVLTYLEFVSHATYGDHSQERLMSAARSGDVSGGKYAVMSLVNQCDLNGTTALMLAHQGHHADMVSWLLAIGADPHAMDVFGDTYMDYGV